MKRCDPSAAYLFNENSVTGDLLRTLQAGEQNALTSHELQALFGITFRELRLIVERARREGVYIITSNEGYFYPNSIDEVNGCLRRTNNHLKNLAVTFAPLRKYARELHDDL